MTPAIASNNPFDRMGDTGTPTTVAKGGDIDKNMFLQLLVAQLRNQDPLNPSEGTEFVAQLAQFQQLEQGINAAQDIKGMRTALEEFLASHSGSGAASGAASGA
jgi:flagellar basal-body rod modification protein FlgD